MTAALVAISIIFSLAAVALSFYLIYKHLISYTKPRYQRHIIRILLMVPIYALCAICTLVDPENFFLYDLLRSVYEAFVIWEFFSLLLHYLGENVLEQHRALSNKKPFTSMRLRIKPNDPHFLMDIKISVMQYIVIRPLTAVVSFSLNAQGKLESDEAMNVKNALFWMNTINFMATSIALYGLFIFYLAIRQEIREFHPITKFLSVKFVIFMTFWQALGIDVLDHFGLLPDTDISQPHMASITFQSLLICVEMFLASLWHMSATCFGYQEFATEDQLKPRPIFALLDTFNPFPTLFEILSGIRYVIVRLYRYILQRANDGREMVSSEDHPDVAVTGVEDGMTTEQQRPGSNEEVHVLTGYTRPVQ